MPSTLRSGALLVGCGVVGAVAALAVAGAGGWLGGDTTVERVAAPPPDSGATSPISLPKTPAGGLDAQQLYKDRSPGVVTIDVVFTDGSVFSGSGFVVDAKTGLILTNSHVITNSGSVTDPNAVHPGDHVYVEQLDGERAKAKVVGFDLFDDVGVLRVDPSRMHLQQVPLGRPRASPSASRSPRSAARSARRGRSRSASSPRSRARSRRRPGCASRPPGRSRPTLPSTTGTRAARCSTPPATSSGSTPRSTPTPSPPARGARASASPFRSTRPSESLRQILKGGSPATRGSASRPGCPSAPPWPSSSTCPSRTARWSTRSRKAAPPTSPACGQAAAAIYAGEVIHPGRRHHRQAREPGRALGRGAASAVSTHPPGANVPVRYYRDGKEQTAHMVLQNRPLVPAGGCPTWSDRRTAGDGCWWPRTAARSGTAARSTGRCRRAGAAAGWSRPSAAWP